MKQISVLVGVVVALLAATTVQAAVVTIDFDDLTTSQSWAGPYGTQYYGVIPLTYQGLTWTPQGEYGWNVGDGPSYKTAYRNSYDNPSLDKFAYNSGLAVTQASGGLFEFLGAQFSTWAQNNQFVSFSSRSVTITGYLGNSVVDSYTLALSSSSYTAGRALTGFVDKVDFKSDSLNDGKYWLMDDMIIDPQSPEPQISAPEPLSLLIWLLLGGVGIGLSYWRRKRAA